MRRQNFARKTTALVATVCLATMGLTGAPTVALAEQAASLTAQSATEKGASTDEATLSYDAELAFGTSSITETTAGSGYSIDGTALTISAAGTYYITGTCTEGSITVAKGLSDVALVLDGLTLASSSTAPIVVKKGTTAAIHLKDGSTSTITNNENPENETSTDATVAEAFEGACIKVKSASNVTFCGGGNLTCVANAKNGIKGGATTALTFNQSGTIKVSGSYSGYATTAGAVNNGIASDGSLTFNQGTFDIDAANDGIKSTPDATDADEGTTFDGDSEGAVTINGGTFDIAVDGDGIQADTALTIANGDFTIQTMNGYNTQGTKYATNGNTSSQYTFDPDSMSCKALKASGDRANEDEEDEFTPTLTITGGEFTINSADDAIHSDVYAVVTGGTFDISTGDDGMHADTSLILGEEKSTVERDPDVTIKYSYEGLEGGTVYMYQGRYHVTAKDDGVNAAGGSDSSGTEAGGGGFNPGGGGPGGGFGGTSTTSTSDYNVYIYGGSLYVYCDGDGLDSNGGLYLYGGMQEVFSQSQGDNSAIDADGTISINGATIFTAGVAGMDTAQSSWFGSSQKYKTLSSSLSAGKVVNATLSGTTLYSTKLTKAASYFMYSAPGLSSAPTLSSGTSLTACKAGSWSHSWSSGTESDGVITYTCSCGETETQTVAPTTSVAACSHTAQNSTEVTDEGYTATFAGDSGVESINVYYKKDYTSVSDSVAATGTTVSRNSDTGEPDSTGDGQLNFQVVLKDGYSISSVTATSGTYRNIKGPSDTGQANTYRITKVSGDTTITITTVQCSHTDIDESSIAWTWEDDCSAATMSAYCNDCETTVKVDATVTSKLTSSDTITFTASVTLGENTYTATTTAAPFTATFAGDAGVDSIDVYYTQDYTTASETNATTAVARDGDTGVPLIDGSGQLNFLVKLKDGYSITSVSATSGTYRNIKGPSDTEQANTYRITKVSGDTTITIATTDAQSYAVAYAFVSGTDGASLPDEVTALLPTDAATYIDGSTVTAATLSSTSVAVDGGTWTFAGWDASSKTVDGADITFTGTWTYVATTDSEAGSTDSGSSSAGDSDSDASSAAVTPASSVAAGASAEAVDALLTSRTTDTDPAGSVFSKLRLKVKKVTKKYEKLTWTKVSGATKYIVYGNKCGKYNRFVKLATVKGKKWTNKKLKKGTYYKYLVVAVNASGKVVTSSKVVHVATKGGKVTNPKTVKLTVKKTGKKAKKATLAKGKTLKLKAKVIKQIKKLKMQKHRKVKWESSNTKVATVSASGKVKAVGKGTCYVYAYAQNGVFAKCKITVK